MSRKNDYEISNVEQVESFNGELVDNNELDFNDPSTILSYGQNLLEEMGSYVNNVSTLGLEDTHDFNVEDILNKINNFSKYLAKPSKTKKIESQVPSIIKVPLLKIKERVFGSDSYGTTFEEAYEEINGDIDAIQDNIRLKAANTNKRIKINKEYKKSMEFYVQSLEELILNGEEKLQTYIDSFEEPSEENQVMINLAKKKIDSLKRALLAFKNTILESQSKINVDYELMIEYQDYSSSTINILRNQATSMVTTKQQRDDITDNQKLIEITNNVLKNNSKTVAENIKDVNALKAQGSISMDTLQQMINYTKEGIKLIEKANADEPLNLEKSRAVMERLSKDLEDTAKSMKSLTNVKINALTTKKQG